MKFLLATVVSIALMGCEHHSAENIVLVKAERIEGAVTIKARVNNSYDFDVCFRNYVSPQHDGVLIGRNAITTDRAGREISSGRVGYPVDPTPEYSLRVPSKKTTELAVLLPVDAHSWEKVAHVQIKLYAYDCKTPIEDRHILDIESEATYPALVAKLSGLARFDSGRVRRPRLQDAEK